MVSSLTCLANFIPHAPFFNLKKFSCPATPFTNWRQCHHHEMKISLKMCHKIEFNRYIFSKEIHINPRFHISCNESQLELHSNPINLIKAWQRKKRRVFFIKINWENLAKSESESSLVCDAIWKNIHYS